MGGHVRVVMGAVAGLFLLVASAVPGLGQVGMLLEEYWAPGRGLHDAVPDGTGWVWYTAQGEGAMGGINPFDPTTETFTTIVGTAPLRVAQLGGVPGSVWGVDRDRQHVVVVRY